MTGTTGLFRAPDRLYGGYLLDLDGTVYLGEELLPGAARAVEGLRRLGRRVLFLSNNPTSDPRSYARRLTALGLPADPADVLTSVAALTRWLARRHPGATVFPIGEEPLRRALRQAGFTVSDDPSRIDVVVASFDRGFTYAKLQTAFDALWYHRRARLVATNPDPYCPMPGGHGQPDAGAVLAAVEACTGARCEAVLGKPSPEMAAVALEALGLGAPECLVTGDRLSTDAALGRSAGMDAAVVLTGETTPERLTRVPAAERPTWVLRRLDDLVPTSARAGLGWAD